jgi:hypothetical protein
MFWPMMKLSLGQNTFFVYFRYIWKVGYKPQGYFCTSSNINPPYCTLYMVQTVDYAELVYYWSLWLQKNSNWDIIFLTYFKYFIKRICPIACSDKSVLVEGGLSHTKILMAFHPLISKSLSSVLLNHLRNVLQDRPTSSLLVEKFGPA